MICANKVNEMKTKLTDRYGSDLADMFASAAFIEYGLANLINDGADPSTIASLSLCVNAVLNIHIRLAKMQEAEFQNGIKEARALLMGVVLSATAPDIIPPSTVTH